MIRILITGVGGPTPRSIARSLKSFGSYEHYALIGTDCDPYAIGLYRPDLFEKTYLVPPATDTDYWRVISEIADEHRIDLAIVQPEIEVLEWAREERDGELPCKSLLPGYDLARILTDKARMSEVLAPSGLVPSSVVLDVTTQSVEDVEVQLTYPFWIRGATGSSGVGSLKIESSGVFDHWIRINENVSKFVASEYLPGRNLACKMLYINGNLVRSACGERVNYIMSKVAPSGVTGNTSFGRLLNEQGIIEVARDAMDVLFTASGSPRHGFYTVDLKEDSEGRPLVTEVNVRHVAFTGCFAEAGAFFAEDSIRILCGDPTFDLKYKQYTFLTDMIFLRDVDERPVVMRESDLFR